MTARHSFAELASNAVLAFSDGYRTKKAELGDSGFPVLRVAEVDHGRIAPTYVDHVRTEFASKIGSKLSQAGDVLLTTKGTVGRRAIMPATTDRFAYSPQLCFFRVTDDDVLDRRWLYYWLGSREFWSQASGVSQQTDMAPYISLRDLREIRLPLPAISEQRAIAATLGALDDKIESNRRIGDLALELAVSLYERSCMDGCDGIPLKEAGRWMSGNTPRTSNAEYWGGDLPWISSASLRGFFVDASDRCLTPAGASAASNIAQPGTVLFVVRGMSLKSEFRVGVAQRPVAFGQDCKAIVPSIDPSVLGIGLWALRDEILDLVDEAGHGTGRLQTDRIEQVEIRVPRDPGVAQSLQSLIARGASAKQESRRLASLRDTLVPELLSGRIRVAEDTDALAEATA